MYAYCGSDPVNRIDPNGNKWWDWAIPVLQIVVGTILCITGVGGILGGMLISSGVMGLTGQIVGAQIAGGIGTTMNGYGAVSTGVNLLAFGPWGVVAGIALIAVGVGTMIMGGNEVVAGITGTNYMRDGMGAGLYDGLYLGLNITSSVGTLAGNIGMRFASNHILNSIVQNPENINNYSLSQVKTYGKYTSQYTVGTLDSRSVKAGQGYTLTHNTRKSLGYIQYHPGKGHHGPSAYWKVTSSFNPTARFWYLTGLPF